jgi:hypothetical protein
VPDKVVVRVGVIYPSPLKRVFSGRNPTPCRLFEKATVCSSL